MKFDIKYLLYAVISSSVLLVLSTIYLLRTNVFLNDKIRKITMDLLQLRSAIAPTDESIVYSGSDSRGARPSVKKHMVCPRVTPSVSPTVPAVPVVAPPPTPSVSPTVPAVPVVAPPPTPSVDVPKFAEIPPNEESMVAEEPLPVVVKQDCGEKKTPKQRKGKQ